MSDVDVYVGAAPIDDWFDVVIAPGVPGGGVVRAAKVEALVEQARPALEILCGHPVGRLVRDDFVALVRNVAPAEAVRNGAAGTVRSVTTRHSVSRPTRPGRVGEGLARLGDVPLVRRGPPVPDMGSPRIVAAARSARWSRLPAPDAGSGIVLAVGGPSERRALTPVKERLTARGDTVHVVEFATEPMGLPSLMAVAPWAKGNAAELYDVLRAAWSTPGWGGAAWLPWVERSLRAMAGVVGREAAVTSAGADRVLAGASVVVTAKVRWTRARALTAAAQRAEVPVVACQHGVHTDGIEWEGQTADVFGVAGDSFGEILRRRGFGGAVRPIGATFFDVLPPTHDGVLALRPVEASIIRSAADYLAHLEAGASALRRQLGAGATLALRPHPRERIDDAAAALLRAHGIDVDPAAAAPVWLAVESSVVAQAALAGGRVVMFSLNGHEWAYDFHELPGVWTARTNAELTTALRNAHETDPMDLGPWRTAHGNRLGIEAADALAAVILEAAGGS